MAKMKNFGVGFLTLIPAATTAVPVPTPIQVGILKDVSMDVSFTTKSLTGNRSFPEDVARGEGKWTGKAKSGELNTSIISSILSGSTESTGSVAMFNETLAVPSSVAYVVTASKVASGVLFDTDMGVYVPSSNTWLKKVTGTVATGQYSVSAVGVYTLYSDMSAKDVTIFYSYATAASGTTVNYKNQLMGESAVYSLTLFNNYRGVNHGIKLPCVTFSKMTISFKNTDHSESDFDFEAFSDNAGNIVYEYMS